jgi:hypothetical protein
MESEEFRRWHAERERKEKKQQKGAFGSMLRGLTARK